MLNNCYYCGQNEQDFIHSGKLGCEYCIGYLQQIKTSNQNYSWILRPIIGVPDLGQILKLGNILESTDPRDLLKEGSRILFRYRISRNRKGAFLSGKRACFPFPEIRNFLLEEFPQIQYTGKEGEMEFQIDPGWATVFRRNSHLKAFRFRLGDEDELRFEVIGEMRQQKSLKPLFQSMGWVYEREFQKLWKWLSCPKRFAFHRRLGFVNSCPTNLGRGDRFSLVMDATGSFDRNLCREQTIWEEEGFSFAFLRTGESPGRGKEVLAGWKVSVKNFNFRRKFYFQHTLLPLIFKWSGLWRQCKTSSNR